MPTQWVINEELFYIDLRRACARAIIDSRSVQRGQGYHDVPERVLPPGPVLSSTCQD